MGIKIEDTFNPISTGAGVLTSIIGAISARKQMKASIRAQQDENQKTRQYNLMLAQLQNQWNQQQWERENAYNSPIAQMQRYKDAGLNPNLIYGQENLSAASPEMTSGSPGYSADTSAIAQMPTIGDAALRGLDTALKAAQIKNIEADTDKKNAETEGQKYQNVIYKADADVADQMAKGKLKLLNTTIECEYEGTQLTKEKKIFVQKTCQKIDKELPILEKNLDLLSKQIESIDIDNGIKEIDKFFRSSYWSRTLQNLQANTNHLNAQAKEIYTLLDAKKKVLESTADYNEKKSAFQDIQNFIVGKLKEPPKFDLGKCDSWAEFELELRNIQGYMQLQPGNPITSLTRALDWFGMWINGADSEDGYGSKPYMIPR